MNINIDEIKKLIKERFHNNQTYFAYELNINKSYLNTILTGKKINNSPKFLNNLIKYCKENNLNYKNYIFFN